MERGSPGKVAGDGVHREGSPGWKKIDKEACEKEGLCVLELQKCKGTFGSQIFRYHVCVIVFFPCHVFVISKIHAHEIGTFTFEKHVLVIGP